MSRGMSIALKTAAGLLLVAAGFAGGFAAKSARHEAGSSERMPLAATYEQQTRSERARFSAGYLCRSAPDFVSSTIDGTAWRLSDHRGKVVVLDFWATWCGPCIRALPGLKRIQERYGDRPDFALIGMSVDVSPKDVELFCEEWGIDWTQLVEPGKDWDSEAALAFGIETVPSVWVIDREGRLVGAKVHYGELEDLLAGMLGP